MTAASTPKSSRIKVAKHRARLRALGLRPVQLWVPDVRAPSFRHEAHRQSAVAAGMPVREEQAYLAGLPWGRPMKRGDIWTVAGGGGDSGTPRRVVVVQEDAFDATDAITMCALTAADTEAPLLRIPVEPNARNGLHAACSLMVDKITTVHKATVVARVGRLDDDDVVRLNRAMTVFLGLAVSPRAAL